MYNQQPVMYQQNQQMGYQQPMQPQMGYVQPQMMSQPMMQQPQMVQQVQPQWTTAPMANQPSNMTQTGIPFDRIRQDLAQNIAMNANNDTLAASLFSQASFNNYLNGKMDKMVSTMAKVIDLEAMKNPNKVLDTIYQEALTEAFWCAWAAESAKYPQVFNDPNLANTVNSWITVGANRRDELMQRGLLQNNPVQQVPSYQMNQPFNNGYSQYGRLGNPNANRTGLSTANTPMMTQQQQPQKFEDQQGGIGFRATPSDLRKLKEQQQANGKVFQYKPYNPNAVVEEPKQAEPVQQPVQQVQQPVNQNMGFAPTIPPGNRTMPSLPTKQFQQQQAIKYGEQPLASQVVPLEQGREEDDRVIPVNQDARQMIQQGIGTESFWSTPKPQFLNPMEGPIEPAIKKDASNDENYGLLDDEVCYLSRSEVKRLLDEGLTFEPPFKNIAPSADPYTRALHFTLTRGNRLRAIITPLDENGKQMERSHHHDILNFYRKQNEESAKRQGKPNTRPRFITTTSGGVKYDRFADSRIVLNNALKEASAKINEEGLEGDERMEVINNAYRIWKKSFERELVEDYNGVAQYKADHPSDDPEDPNMPNEIELPTEEREERMTARLEQLPEEEIVEVVSVNNPLATSGQFYTNILEDNKPYIEDKIYHENFEVTEPIMVFNTPEEKAEVMEKMKDFIWPRNPSKDYLEDLRYGEDYAEQLQALKDNIPEALWKRFSLYGTSIVNKGLKYIFQSNASIDDIGEDYREIISWANTRHAEGEFHEPTIPLALLSLTVASHLQCIADESSLIALDENEMDQVELRALVKTTGIQNTTFPVVAEKVGLPLEDIVITADTHNELFPIVRNQYDKQFASRQTHVEGRDYLPISDTYLTFAAGEKYRVWPTVSLENETGEEITAFTLEYLGNEL